MELFEEIVGILEESGVPLTQAEISAKLKTNINRAVLLGYLRAISDLGKIRSKDSGKAKVYFLSKSF